MSVVAFCSLCSSCKPLTESLRPTTTSLSSAIKSWKSACESLRPASEELRSINESLSLLTESLRLVRSFLRDCNSFSCALDFVTSLPRAVLIFSKVLFAVYVPLAVCMNKSTQVIHYKLVETPIATLYHTLHYVLEFVTSFLKKSWKINTTTHFLEWFRTEHSRDKAFAHMDVLVPSPHRESTDSLIMHIHM